MQRQFKKTYFTKSVIYDATKAPPLNESFLFLPFMCAFPGQTKISNSINADQWGDKWNNQLQNMNFHSFFTLKASIPFILKTSNN